MIDPYFVNNLDYYDGICTGSRLLSQLSKTGLFRKGKGDKVSR